MDLFRSQRARVQFSSPTSSGQPIEKRPFPVTSPVRIELANLSCTDWDAFARQCDASYRGLSGWMRVRQAQRLLPFRIYRFSFLRSGGGAWAKIGQCAIGVGPQCCLFHDGLQLLPQYQDTWSACMQAVLNELGPGQYVYGSDWSLETPREHEIAALPGVSVTAVARHIVEAVDFARWDSWSSYERNISSNVRRNVKRARAIYEPVSIELKRGAAALRLTRDLLKFQLAMYRRKSVPGYVLKMTSNHTRHILRLMSIPEYAFCAVLRKSGHTLAAFGSTEVGRHVYYFDGGSIDTEGTGWLLKMTLMQDFYARHPTGRFLMGSSPADAEQTDGWESLMRYRRDCRVSAFPTSRVTFTYAAEPRF
jgi:hypothetical protein